MKISIPAALEPLIEVFQTHGQPLYLVGGSVRNALLGLPGSDVDVCGAATPKQVMDILQGSDMHVVPVALDFGTVQIHIPERDTEAAKQEQKEKETQLIVEYTTFRSDRYDVGGGHRPQQVVFSSSLEKDAFRRDFSVNALYASLPDGEVIDPTGGLYDLENRRLRTTSDDPDGILRDDALRTLRLVRFCAELGFAVEEKTWESTLRFAPQLANIAVERIWKELRKILMSDIRYHATQPTPEPAHERALRMMVKLGLMENVFPELLEGRGIEQSEKYHAYDVLWHNIKSCGVSKPILTVRLAALLHDVGKPRALAENGRMLGHDIIGAELAEAMLNRLRVDRATTRRVAELVRIHMFDLNNNAKTGTLRKHLARMGEETAREFADVREADFVGSGLQSPPIASAERYRSELAQMIRDGAPFSPDRLQIDGREIAEAIGCPPGPAIGEIKRRLWLHCAARPRDNRKKQLIRLARNFARVLPGLFDGEPPTSL